MFELYQDSDQERFVQEAPKDPSRTEFERDRARILHSAALRRLGAKTQVLGPESDDFIRTRLTHSLEVAQVGRALAKNLGVDPDIVETACLSHDIGHPPYGHNGERALDELSQNIGGFEGNAQTLRVISRLEQKRYSAQGRSVGLNLTRATTDAVLKYPWARFAGPQGRASTKFGVYDDDFDVFAWAHGEHGERRCIEAQIMDLSDDIAYCVHDVEDSIVGMQMDPNLLFGDVASSHAELDAVIADTLAWYPRAVTSDELVRAYETLAQMEAWPTSFNGTGVALAQLKDLTSDLIGHFIGAVTAATHEQYGAQAHSRYSANAVVPRDILAQITFLKGLAVHYVMAPRETEPLYYEQRTILFDLMDAIGEAPQDRLEPVFLEQWREAPTESAKERAMIDQLASLTDSSARLWHSRYCGMLRN